MVKRIYNQGGLGNQLFIWRAAHNLHLTSEEPVEILGLRGANHWRPLSLNPIIPFCNHEISIREIDRYSVKIRLAQKYPRLYSLVHRCIPNKLRIQIGLNPQDQIGQMSIDSSDALGFFQNSSDSIWDQNYLNSEILDVLEYILPTIIAKNRSLFENPFQVFHVRRGDYLHLQSEYGLLSSFFYESNMTKNEKVVICTDAEQLEDTFRQNFPEAIVLNPKDFDVWECLAIMVKATHFVGSNSTLSWWAAKLRSENKSTSILPDPWFKASRHSPNFKISGVTFADSVFS